jgi:hypothetical protein
MPVLRILSRDARRVERELPLGGAALTLGRAPENGIVLHDSSVSRSHARIVPTPTGYLLVDLGSANGTWVRGDRLSEAVLVHGDVFRLGDCWMQFVDEQAVPLAPEAPPAPASGSRYWVAAVLVVALGASGCVSGLVLYAFRDRLRVLVSGPAPEEPCSTTVTDAGSCPWSPAGSPAGACPPGFCFDGDLQGVGDCEQLALPDGAERDEAMQVVCRGGATPVRDRCTNAVTRCEP